MDYEKKLERAKELYETANEDQRYVLESLFPELIKKKEERIKDLIYCLIRDRSNIGKLLEDNGVSIEEALTWLEKQGEQKLTETAKWSPQEESCICQLESLNMILKLIL